MLLTNQIGETADIAHRLTTNTLSKSKRVQRWGNFIAGFSIEFVEQCLSQFSPDSGLVLDPFSGCGTTLVAARNLGFAAVGYELHPIFNEIGDAKIQNYKASDLDEIFGILRNPAKSIPWSPDAELFLRKLFTEENLVAIGSAAARIGEFPRHLRALGDTAFLRACEYACGSQTDGIYKAPTSKKNHIPFSKALQSIESELREDIQSDWYRNHWSYAPAATLHHKSSTDISELEDNTVCCCITSPPYLNNFDYAEMTRMHLYLLGWCTSWRDISERIRNHLITNTTTAIKYKKSIEYQDTARAAISPSLAAELEPLIADLTKERKTRAGKKDYDYLVYPYYAEITQVLQSIYAALKPEGSIHWVVADAALYGVHLETQEHTATIMRELGFRDVRVHFIRRRGHRWVLSKRDGAKKGLGEYHIEGTK